MFKIIPVAVLSDNSAIDVVEPQKIINAAKENDVSITTVLSTHHHWDHMGGNEEIKSLIPGLKIYGGDSRIPGITDLISSETPFTFANYKISPLMTPCHTTGHLCYHLEHENESVVFTGDTLFIAGCGRFFEGTPENMINAMTKLSQLDPKTLVYCGHEYTTKNVEFALTVDKNNLDLVGYSKRIGIPSIPSSISQELKINPFMRVSKLLGELEVESVVEGMKKLREMKDRYK